MDLLIYVIGLFFLFLYGILWKKGNMLPAYVMLLAAFCMPVAAAWKGMDFSPSFTMQFLTANVFLCALAEGIWCFRWFDADLSGGELKKIPSSRKSYGTVMYHRAGKGLEILQRGLFLIGILCSIPSVYIYATGEDFLLSCRNGALAGGILFTGLLIWLRKKNASGLASTDCDKRQNSVPAAEEKKRSVSVDSDGFGTGISNGEAAEAAGGLAIETSYAQTAEAGFTAAAGLFALFCGMRSPALLPYGAGILFLCAARLWKDSCGWRRECLFWIGLVCASLFSLVPSL